MKVQNKEQIKSKNLLKYILSEKNVMQQCNSPFIVKLYHAFQTEQFLVFVMDYCPGGNLYQFLQQNKRFDEDLSQKYLCEIILALQELHYSNIIYRDMKPENIVLCQDGHLKLIDFGLSKEDLGLGTTSTFCGSGVYLAPEVISKKGHNKTVDWYQLGILAYELMVGQPPFNQFDRKQLYYNIQNKKAEFPNFISLKAKSLISQLINKNPEERLGSGKNDAEEIKNHEFFQNINWFDVKQKYYQLPKPLIKNIPEKQIDLDIGFYYQYDVNLIQDWDYIDEEEML